MTTVSTPVADRASSPSSASSASTPVSSAVSAAPAARPAAAAATTARRRTPWSADLYADALRAGRGPLFLRRPDGWLLPLDIERWCAGPDEADRSVLRQCRGSVLDIGCGPGRMAAELARRGQPALGIDITPAAVERTRAAGATALLASVFDPLPQEGEWGSALLLDGNIGIGGDPPALLARIRELLAPGGRLLAEAAPVGVDERLRARLDNGRGEHGPSFPWARAGRAALRGHAERTGWRTAAQWRFRGRHFLLLDARRRP
ncbi:class I SAM-dependent methyltransferase [Streptomyces aidingensis]|uniref:Methyltransferase domain-containing protein n=1 Tax=Streptomyces aidingensis TaxID=910347 RepID=A0A1I1MEN9_9ACTN|nr:class I SAM-dependent methyltransferase [Streptomyces aidingensis]SFC83941.1 Methyltransferase domain-containing protein [Streptomyces aidingensis]